MVPVLCVLFLSLLSHLANAEELLETEAGSETGCVSLRPLLVEFLRRNRLDEVLSVPVVHLYILFFIFLASFVVRLVFFWFSELGACFACCSISVSAVCAWTEAGSPPAYGLLLCISLSIPLVPFFLLVFCLQVIVLQLNELGQCDRLRY